MIAKRQILALVSPLNITRLGQRFNIVNDDISRYHPHQHVIRQQYQIGGGTAAYRGVIARGFSEFAVPASCIGGSIIVLFARKL